MGSGLLENYIFPENVDSEVAPAGSCEFAGPKLFDGASGRKCQYDGIECFGFSDPLIYASCPTRREPAKRSRE